ncbi:hypothetical protein HZB78_01165 [Candidatus Collierbacteria bacterium]|nr:hypothetical protein [Candidatus Collierbacteria bacterium]
MQKEPCCGKKGRSQIIGAIPLSTIWGERVIAAGELTDGKDDIAAIRRAVDSIDSQMGLVLLDELSR